MPWLKGYYYRSIRVNGQPRLKYVGKGEAACAAADADRERRINRERAEHELAQWQAVHKADDQSHQQLQQVAEMLSRVAMYGTGHHQHDHGEWRRKRGLKRQ